MSFWPELKVLLKLNPVCDKLLRYRVSVLYLGSKNFKPKSFWRINENIRAGKLRVVGHDGHQIGVLSLGAALKEAQKQELDLVEIAPKAVPPVAKIVNFAKFRYQQDKKEREALLKEKKGTEQKEIWLTPFMADNDYLVRLDRIKEFLQEGHKVRITVKFTGRQMAHKEFGYQLADRVLKDTGAKRDGEIKFLGRQLMTMLSPVKGGKKEEDNAKTQDTKKLSSQNQGQ